MTPSNNPAPHECPKCGCPAYNGFTDLQCTWQGCEHYHAATDEAWRAYKQATVITLDDNPRPLDPHFPKGWTVSKSKPFAVAADKVPRHPSHYVTAFEAALPGCYVRQVSMTQDRYNHGVHLDIKVFVPDLVWRVKPTPTPSATPYPLTQTGTKLDAWAKRCGFPDRAPGETDDELRQRVIAGLKGQP